ncbi:MAG: flagellar basal body L-ring protein FlgH [Bdellovibrio sp.]|jgi:flagellar L-ring protein precursor FlgH
MKNACHLGLMVFLTLAAVLSVGCASIFQDAKESMGLIPTTAEGENITKFSENPSVLNVANRNYKRMTRQRMEEEAEIHSQAGSMWVNDGQAGYLFAQNKSRREGDLLNVKIEGAAQKQIETKVAVIKKLLKQLEEEELKSQKAGQQLADGGAGEAKRAPAAAAKPEEKDEPLSLEAIPTRIVERTPDGNYRVKGQQPFMIGKREYKVIVTGLVRPEDFNDEGIASGKLLDPQYDVVSIRKKEKTSL